MALEADTKQSWITLRLKNYCVHHCKGYSNFQTKKCIHPQYVICTNQTQGLKINLIFHITHS